MKKTPKGIYEYSKRRQLLKLKKEKRTAGFQSQRIKKFIKKKNDKQKSLTIYHLKRGAFRKKLYSKYTYKELPKEVKISGEFGIEEKEARKNFIESASRIIDFNSRELILDFSECTRVWPSAVTLLCSLKKWVEICCRHKKFKPKISSTLSNCKNVNSYLYHCGFNEYVGLSNYKDNGGYNEREVVKIQRELNHANIESRENEIVELLERSSSLSTEQIEWFNNVILTEIFINVSEHGVALRGDQGWWLLAQYHEKHSIISLSIADNGIGIKNTLATGPQWVQIAKEVPPEYNNDGDFIRHAMKQNVSGAIQAQIKEKGLLRSKFPIGSKRGNGLNRILGKCQELGIELSILSHYGYLFYDKCGDEISCGAQDKRIFAGTLYHLSIPARKA